MAKKNTLPAASIARLIGSWLYDFMLLCAVWLLAGIIYIIPAQLINPVDSSQVSNLSTNEFTGPFFYSYLFIISWFFFAWFWVHGGQTLGLKSWSLQIQTAQGQPLNWTQSLLRFLVAGTPWVLSLFIYKQLLKTELLPSPYEYGAFLLAFCGLLWILVDKQKRSLQDIFSHTRIVRIAKTSRKQS